MTPRLLAFVTVDRDPEIEVVHDVYFECTGCGKCCQLNKIPASEQDLARMQEHGIELDVAIEVMSPILIQSKTLTDTRIKAYVLRQKPFIGGCAFLTEDNRCKIHEFKPLACKTYPFSLRRTDDGRIAIYEHPNSVCDYVFEPTSERPGNMEQIAKNLALVLVEDLEEGKRLGLRN